MVSLITPDRPLSVHIIHNLMHATCPVHPVPFVLITLTPLTVYLLAMGRDSSVDIAILYGEDGPGIESVEVRFSIHLLIGHGSHPASYTVGTGPLSRE